MNDYKEFMLGIAMASVAFLAASLASLGHHLEGLEKITSGVIFRRLGLQLTLMPAVASLAGWLVAAQEWTPLSMIPLGLAAGWGGFAFGEMVYQIFVTAMSRVGRPKE